jgi:hypothetical protein
MAQGLTVHHSQHSAAQHGRATRRTTVSTAQHSMVQGPTVHHSQHSTAQHGKGPRDAARSAQRSVEQKTCPSTAGRGLKQAPVTYTISLVTALDGNSISRHRTCQGADHDKGGCVSGQHDATPNSSAGGWSHSGGCRTPQFKKGNMGGGRGGGEKKGHTGG